MSSKQFKLILLAVLGLCIIVFFALVGLGLSALSSKSKADAELRLQNQTADAQLANLEASKKQIQQYSYFRQVASTVIPNDKDQAQAVLDIFQMADQAGISLQSVTFPNSNLGLHAAASTSAASASPAATLSQALPVKGIPGLYSVQLIISPETGAQVPQAKWVTYPKLLQFLQSIENNRRTAQIAQLDINPLNSTPGNQIDFTLTVNIFIKP